MTQTISRLELQAKLNAGETITVIEALPPHYYQQGHLPGAINIPHDQIRERAASLLPDQGQAIVVYCANTPCQNSSIAANTLSALGYRNVREYVEGKQDWVEAGLPLESA